jgi:hypothetical protein
MTNSDFLNLYILSTYIHKLGSDWFWTWFTHSLNLVQPSPYLVMVWNCSTAQYVPPCTTGLDPSVFGFSEECSGYTTKWNVCTCQYWVYHEHSSEKPNTLGSRPVVQGGIYWIVPVYVGLYQYQNTFRTNCSVNQPMHREELLWSLIWNWQDCLHLFAVTS